MSPDLYCAVKEEAHRYPLAVVQDDEPDTIILNSDGSQVPMGKIYGMDIYIDEKLPGYTGYVKEAGGIE